MKRNLLITSAILSCMLGLPASAQSMDVPDFLKNMDGLTYHGEVGGLSLYRTEGFAGNWFVTPDGKMAIAGAMFGPTGRDIGAALTDSEAIKTFEMNELSSKKSDVTNNVPAGNDQTSSSKLDDTARDSSKIGNLSPSNPSIAAQDEDTESSQEVQEEAISDTEDMSNQTSPSSSNLAGMIATDGAALIENAQNALVDFTPQERSQLLQLLIDMLGDVKTEVEFKAVVRAWTEEIAFIQAERSGISLPDDMLLKAPIGVVLGDYDGDGVVDEEIDMDATTGEDVVLPVGENPNTIEDAMNAEVVTSASTADEGEDQLLEQMADRTKRDSFWFAVGADDAPVVYAYIDPDCPFCARAINNLDETVKNGDLQLRILLSPVVSQRSPDLIAGILTSENPEDTFWNHSLSKVTGAPSPLQPSSWDGLPEEARAAVLKNVDILLDFEVPGVPFFIFETEEGLKYANGVPVANTFEGAVNDTFGGN